MPVFHAKSRLDKIYEVGLAIKGIDGVLELIGGILILTLNPGTITGVTRFLTESALQANPHNYIAYHIAHVGHSLAAGHNVFAAAFLLTHGLVKVGLVVCLLLNKLWAYPWALALLSLFLVYQIYQLITSPGAGMAFLTVLDILIIALVYREWRQQTAPPAKPVSAAD
jgi:uncharacterized membrane protein